jgi:hypothetical protein
MHDPVYDFFRDQGSIIAGFLALVAGLLAYCIGKRQLAQRNGEALEHDRRTRLDLLALFESQAAQIAMLATMRRVEAEKHVGSSIHVNVSPEWARAFIITWAEIEAPGLSSLVPGQVRLAALELRASVHRLIRCWR